MLVTPQPGGGGGGGTPTTITPYIYANGVWVEESTATVASGVHCGPRPAAGQRRILELDRTQRIHLHLTPDQQHPVEFRHEHLRGHLHQLQQCQRAPRPSPSTVTGGGGCTPTAITPYLQVNGAAWERPTLQPSLPDRLLNLGPQPISGGLMELDRSQWVLLHLAPDQRNPARRWDRCLHRNLHQHQQLPDHRNLHHHRQLTAIQAGAGSLGLCSGPADSLPKNYVDSDSTILCIPPSVQLLPSIVVRCTTDTCTVFGSDKFHCTAVTQM